MKTVPSFWTLRRKYADSFSLLTQATKLVYDGFHRSSDDFEYLVEALPDFPDLSDFAFSRFKLSTDQARRLGVSGVQSCFHVRQSSQLEWAVFTF